MGIIDVYELLACFTDEKFPQSETYKITEDDRKITTKMLKKNYRKNYGKDHPEVKYSLEIFDSMPVGSVFRSDTVLSLYHTLHKPIKHRYTGKTYLLTNGMSYSASVIFADLFKSRKLGLVAGESPGGYRMVSSGDAITEVFPYSRFIMNVSLFGDKEKIYEYVEPDILIKPTFDEWLHNKKHDSLKKLVDMINNNDIAKTEKF